MGIGRALAAAVVAAVILGGCQGDPFGAKNVVTAADRHRLAVMRDDPVFKAAVPGSGYDVVGELLEHDDWRRGQMTATIYQTSSPKPTMSPLPVQAFVRSLLASMRSRGWTVYYSACTFQSVNAGTPPGVFDGPTEWTNIIYAYRIYQGASYWADITTDVNTQTDPQVQTGFASEVSVMMLVPQASEPTSNLFAHRPAALAPASVCAAQAGQIKAPVTEGKPIKVVVQSDDPDPPSAGATLR